MTQANEAAETARRKRMQRYAIERGAQKEVGGSDESVQGKKKGGRSSENGGSTEDIQFGGKSLLSEGDKLARELRQEQDDCVARQDTFGSPRYQKVR